MKASDTLTTIFEHNLWANLRLLERCQVLSTEQFDTVLTGTYGSIQDTLQHLVLAEKGYYARISTGQPYRRPKDAQPLTLSEMKESIQQTGTGLIAWAQKVQAADMVQVDWEGTLRDIPKTIILNQVINHATEHRAQIMVILTQLGVEPPSLDSWTYFDELDQG